MSEGTRFGKGIAIAYFIELALVLVFVLYIGLTEGIQENNARKGAPVREYNNMEATLIEDPNAPQGVVKKYTIPIREGDAENGYFCMYAVHSYVEVYSGTDLIYRLKTESTNRFIHSPGCNYVMVPLQGEDETLGLTVLVTPVYKDMIKRRDSFFIGSRLKIYKDRLRNDFLPMLVCFLTILCGLILSFVTFRRYWKGNMDTANGYLGIFACLVGLWKLTDCRFLALVFPNGALLLSLISLATLSISIFPLVNYIRKQVRLKGVPLLEMASILVLLTGAVCFGLEISGIMEYRESLLICHSGIVIAIVTVAITGIRALMIEKKNDRIRMALLFLSLCVMGAVIDLVIFYIKGSSASIIFIVVAFLAYITYAGINNNMELTQRANRDLFTGLFNRSRCNELLKDPVHMKNLCAFVMMDLNDLKVTNDTLGHEAGDRMILGFVDIVKSESIPGTFIGRYGGDEFILFTSDINKKQVDTMLQRIEIGVQMYNASGHKPEISYSMGCVYSDELGEPTINEMFQKADERMYVEKKKYHEAHDRRRS